MGLEWHPQNPGWELSHRTWYSWIWEMGCQQAYCLIYIVKRNQWQIIKDRGQYLSKNHNSLLGFWIRLEPTHWRGWFFRSQDPFIPGQIYLLFSWYLPREVKTSYSGKCAMWEKRNPQNFWRLLNIGSELAQIPGGTINQHGSLLKGGRYKGHQNPHQSLVLRGPSSLLTNLLVLPLISKCIIEKDTLISKCIIEEPSQWFLDFLSKSYCSEEVQVELSETCCPREKSEFPRRME